MSENDLTPSGAPEAEGATGQNEPVVDGAPAAEPTKAANIAEAGETVEAETAKAVADEIAKGETEAAPEPPAAADAPASETPASAEAPVSEASVRPAVTTAPAPKAGPNPAIVAVVAAIVALLVGLAIGAFACNGAAGGGNTVAGKAKLSESELSATVASYTVNGKTQTVTAKEVIEQTSSLDAAKSEDGTYTVPPADSAISVARNRVLLADAEAKGITASDEDLAKYAESQLGTSDFASVAKNYGMSEDAVKNLMRESCIMNKLREQVVGNTDSSAAAMPQPPTEPPASANAAAGSESSASASGEAADPAASGEAADPNASAAANNPTTKEYADYIIALAGSEWDSAKGTWASTDGPYYQALSSYQITPEGASYEAATMAYYVAYQAYAEQSSGSTEAWTSYVNDILAKASITIYTLMA